MTDLQREPMAWKAMNELLDWLKRYPRVSGMVSQSVGDGRILSIKVSPPIVESEQSDDTHRQ